MTLGLTGGGAFAGDQDVRVALRGADGTRVAATEQRGTDASAGPLGGVTFTIWTRRWLGLGLQLDALHWTTSVDVDRALPGLPSPITVDQSRTALLVSVVGRFRLWGEGGPFVYGGVGGGVVYSHLSPGNDAVGVGVGLLGGVAIPLTERLRARVEARYLLAPDVDADRSPGVRVETSGSLGSNPGRAIFGPHLDTQFVPLLVGLDRVF